MMLKKLLLPLIFSAMLFTSACAWFETDNYGKSHMDMIRHFASQGIKIETVEPVRYDLAQAESGFCFKINGRQIGVYKYNTERKKQKWRYQLVKDSGVLYINGVKFKAMINGSFVMIDYESHPDKEKIIKAFKSF